MKHPHRTNGRLAAGEIPGDFWEQVPIGVAWFDAYRRLIHANKIFREFSPRGLNPYFRKFVDPYFDEVEHSGQARVNFALEGRRSVDSGRPDRWMVSLIPRHGPRKKLRGFLLLTQNTTEQKRLEHQLRRAEESLPHALIVADLEGKILRVNAQAERLFGYQPGEMLGQTIEQLIPARFREEHRRHQVDFLADPAVRRMSADANVSGLRKDGREIPIEMSIEPLRTSKGLQIVARIFDISERRQTELRLKESQSRFRLLAETIPVIVFLTGPVRGVTYLNKEGLSFFGMPAEEMLGLGWLQVVHPDDRERINEMSDQIFVSQQPGSLEFRARRADGAYRWLHLVGRPMFDGQNVFTGYIGTANDITDSRQAQIEIQKSQMELSHARRVSTVGELASSLAHELNQPLTAILSNAQAALRFLRTTPANTKEVEEILTDIVSDDKRAGMIIQRLRTFIKKKELETEPLDANELVSGVVGLLRSTALERRVRMTTDLSETLPRIRGDAVQLQQVIMNLILNGLDAMSDVPVEERRLLIQSRASDSEGVILRVRDSGPGVQEADIERIFKPFFTTKKDGLGMGLSIARSIIEAHKGRLWAENNAGRGATFCITLPPCRD